MSSRVRMGYLDRSLITIYFMQGKRRDHKLAVRRVYLVLGMIAVFFGLMFFRVWQEMQVVKLGYQLNQLRHEYHLVAEQQRVLLGQRNALGNLERIETIAREQLNMEPPRGENVIFLVDPAEPKPQWRGWLSQWVPRWFAAEKTP